MTFLRKDLAILAESFVDWHGSTQHMMHIIIFDIFRLRSFFHCTQRYTSVFKLFFSTTLIRRSSYIMEIFSPFKNHNYNYYNIFIIIVIFYCWIVLHILCHNIENIFSFSILWCNIDNIYIYCQFYNSKHYVIFSGTLDGRCCHNIFILFLMNYLSSYFLQQEARLSRN